MFSNPQSSKIVLDVPNLKIKKKGKKKAIHCELKPLSVTPNYTNSLFGKIPCPRHLRSQPLARSQLFQCSSDAIIKEPTPSFRLLYSLLLPHIFLFVLANSRVNFPLPFTIIAKEEDIHSFPFLYSLIYPQASLHTHNKSHYHIRNPRSKHQNNSKTSKAEDVVTKKPL